MYKISSVVKYTYTNSEKDADYISKYALRYAQHLLAAEVSYPLIFRIEQSFNCLYKKRISSEEYFVLDTKLSKEFSLGATKGSPVGNYYIGVDNLLDKNYTEIPFVPMLPRIIYTGIKIDL